MTNSTGEMYTAAIEYASAGWPVLPLKVNSKEPATAHGVYDATTDVDLTERRWADGKPYNIGIAVPEGVAILDVDPRNGGGDTFDALVTKLGPLPSTRTTATRRDGLHLWFSVPLQSKQIRGSLGAGLEVKKAGGYVVVPPSINPETDEPYRWRDSAQIEPLPRAWLRQLRQAPAETPRLTPIADPVAARGFRQWFNGALRHTSEGARNHMLFKAAVSLAALGCLTDEAETELFGTAQAIGLDDYEIERTIRSAKEKVNQ
ncbi:bifunctional DNA primase/polymerase [Gordonia sputi]